MARRCREFVDSRLRRSPPDRASAVPYGQAGENAMRFPRLAHRSAAAHKLHSTPQQDRMNLISGKRETSSRLPAFSLFLPGSCPNYRDRRNKAYGPPPKKCAVFTLVERGGRARSKHIANVTADTVRPIIVTTASRKSHFRTDESGVYWKVGEEFKTHETVVHSSDEYVRGDAHVNTAEGYFALLKRGIYGNFHHISEAHLHRYVAEFDFRYNRRDLSDKERADDLLRGAKGKRLLYRQPDGETSQTTPHA